MAGIFGKMFDFNKNGKLDAGETAAELLFLDMITQREHDAEDGEDGEPFTAYDSEVNVDEDGEDEDTDLEDYDLVILHQKEFLSKAISFFEPRV